MPKLTHPLQTLAQPTQHPQKRCLDDYKQLGCGEDVVTVKQLASLLKGVKVTHINSTFFGGGVAENLSSLISLAEDLGIYMSWQVLQAPRDFFEVTKAIHNAFQGMLINFDQQMAETYICYNKSNARKLDLNTDLVVVHDPQPLPLIDSRKENQKWIWRCHIDPRDASPTIWSFLRPYIVKYDALIFTHPSYVKEDLSGCRVFIRYPTIDPLSDKNKPLSYKEIMRVIEMLGITYDLPLITQVSRFDSWKNPLGVIDIYRLVKKNVPNVQLALIGSLADDDPESEKWLKKTLDYASSDKDIHILTNLTDVEVNAIQRASDVIIQNSTKEGFGLTVSEALWKGTSVVARRVGGIPLQIIDGITGFLCDSPEQMVEKTVYLLTNPKEAEKMGEAGREHIRRNFLITLQLKQDLQLIAQLYGFNINDMRRC